MNIELGSAARFALHGDPALVFRDDFPNYRQTEPARGSLGLGAEKRIKDVPARHCIHSTAGIGEAHTHVVTFPWRGQFRIRLRTAGDPFDRHTNDTLTLTYRPRGIDSQVDHHLLNL